MLGHTPTWASQNGNVTDVKLGMNNDILPTNTSFSGLTVYDRDPWGYAAAARNATGTSKWTLPNMFSGCDASGNLAAATSGFAGTPMTNCAPGGLLYAYRTDGYFNGSLTFRGVRTDSSDTQQWSSPDMYQGMASDPMSGLGYNYAGNNPAMFADPSGFDGQTLTPGGTNCGENATLTSDANGNETVSYWFDGSGCEGLFGDGYGGGGSGGYVPGVGFNFPGVGMYGRMKAQCSSHDGGTPPRPDGVSWSPEYAAGAAHYLDVSAIGPNIGQGGKFDYQRWGGGFNPYFTPASNFGVGIYMNAAGFGLAEMELVGGLYTLAKGNPATLPNNTRLWANGWVWAANNCTNTVGGSNSNYV